MIIFQTTLSRVALHQAPRSCARQICHLYVTAVLRAVVVDMPVCGGRFLLWRVHEYELVWPT